MGVKITKDMVDDVLKAVRDLTKSEILVGIPGENAGREPTPGEPPGSITNVELGYIHEFGSPAQNIPARPFLIPGVEGALPDLLPRLQRAGRAALDFEARTAVTGRLINIGLAAAKAVQMKITDGPFVPISDRTKMGRLTRKESYKNASEKRKRAMMLKWMGGDFKPLIDTGAMRAAVTSVIRPK